MCDGGARCIRERSGRCAGAILSDGGGGGSEVQEGALCTLQRVRENAGVQAEARCWGAHRRRLLTCDSVVARSNGLTWRQAFRQTNRHSFTRHPKADRHKYHRGRGQALSVALPASHGQLIVMGTSARRLAHSTKVCRVTFATSQRNSTICTTGMDWPSAVPLVSVGINSDTPKPCSALQS